MTESRTCAGCGAEHAKKGAFCSRSCANRRTYTPELRKRRSDDQRRYMQSERSQQHREASGAVLRTINATNGAITNTDDWQVLIPNTDDDAFADWDVNSY
jgi:hypothetical protein